MDQPLSPRWVVPKHFVVDLALPPEERWMEVMDHYKDKLRLILPEIWSTFQDLETEDFSFTYPASSSSFRSSSSSASSSSSDLSPLHGEQLSFVQCLTSSIFNSLEEHDCSYLIAEMRSIGKKEQEKGVFFLFLLFLLFLFLFLFLCSSFFFVLIPLLPPLPALLSWSSAPDSLPSSPRLS
jgi:hypothetical protein